MSESKSVVVVTRSGPGTPKSVSEPMTNYLAAGVQSVIDRQNR